ncbi:MAG: phage portal protein [Anaerolineaceae bacterium]|nr:phage portal protein [Anaerolineaceae bacterium]
MIISQLFGPKNQLPAPPAAVVPQTTHSMYNPFGQRTVSGKRVSAETAKKIATAYRCGNILSDDIASMPFQVFQKIGKKIEQVSPDVITRNTSYLMEIQPNRWMTPFIFKKTAILWLLYWGNSYIWEPAGNFREFFILPADRTYPVFDESGNLWYKTFFPSGKEETIPWVEITHLMINSTDGVSGRSVLTYAAETMGRQLGAHETQNRINGNGLNPAGIIWVEGEIADPKARKKLKDEYMKEIYGSENAGGIAVFDDTIGKFEKVTMNPTDAQFLESIEATDSEIANFFGMPLYKLNMGKQSYQSNEQQNLDYLRTTLNPYLVQWEQVARIRWIKAQQQNYTYMRFVRDAILQTDAKTRSEITRNRILSGQLTPNQALQIEDMSPYDGGDRHYFPSNMAVIEDDGSLVAATGAGQQITLNGGVS